MIPEDSELTLLENKFKHIHKYDEIKKMVKDLEIDKYNDEKILLSCRKLIGKDKFAYLPLIRYLILKVNKPTIDFANFILELCEKIGADLTSGELYSTLIEFGKTRKKETLDLINILNSIVSNKKSTVLGTLIGGLCIDNLDCTYIIVEKLRSSDSSEIKAALISISVASKNPRIPDIVKAEVIKICKRKAEKDILLELPNCVASICNNDDSELLNLLYKFSKNNDDSVKYNTAKALHFNNKIKTDVKFDILLDCSQTTNQYVHKEICMVLFQMKDNTDIEKFMKIILSIIEKTKYIDDHVSWILCEFGKKNIIEIAKYLENAFDGISEKNRNMYEFYTIPDILTDASIYNRNDMIKIIEQWANIEKLRNVLLRVIDSLLKDMHLHQHGEVKVLEAILSILSTIAKEKDVKPEYFIKGENELIIKCAKLLRAVEDHGDNIDIKLAENNLKKFIQLHRVLTTRWVENTYRDVPDNILIKYLSLAKDKTEINDMIEESKKISDKTKLSDMNFHIYEKIRILDFLNHLNYLLKNIDEKEEGIGNLKNNFKADCESAISELEFISKLRNKYYVKSYPKIIRLIDGCQKESRLDALINIDKDELLIEVITPKTMPALEYLGVSAIPNRLASKIYSEFNDHFSGMQEKKNIIIVVDCSRSEIGYHEAKTYMEGEPAVTLLLDKETKTIVDSYSVIKTDKSMGKMISGMNNILGIIVYDRVLGKDNKYHLRGRFFSNKYSDFRNKEKTINKLKQAFFG